MMRGRQAAGLRQAPRAALGALVCAAGLLLLAHDAYLALAAAPPAVRGALAGGMAAALATAAGTLPVLLAQGVSQRLYDAALGLGAGIMLAATAFSLVLPAIAASKAGGATPFGASVTVGGGIALGMAAVLLLGRIADHGAPAQPLPGAAMPVRHAWLFVAAVAIHNLPEGLAIGVAYAGVDALKAHSLATGIAIQDIPEGLVVAMALRAVGYGRGFSTAMGMLSGLPEPCAAVAGALLIAYSAALLPWGLAAAAGAMLFVICHEVVPAAHRHGPRTGASCALVAGFIVMMVLDTALA
jgi:ZIP family zinc transporter